MLYVKYQKSNQKARLEETSPSQDNRVTDDQTPDLVFRFLLVGKTGSGKSSTGNTILGQDVFDTQPSFDSVTAECSIQNGTHNGIAMEIMDSPGLFDTAKTHDEVCREVIKAVACMYPGPTAVLYVIAAGIRYTEEDKGVYERLKSLLDNHVAEYMIVIFTRGDDLKKNKRTIEEVLEKAPATLSHVLNECGNRYVVFDNTADDTRLQVDRLLQLVNEVQKEHGGLPYTCPKYAEIDEKMKIEVARRLQEVEQKELMTKKYVQELEEKAKQVREEAERDKREFEKREREREQEIMKKKEEAERDKREFEKRERGREQEMMKKKEEAERDKREFEKREREREQEMRRRQEVSEQQLKVMYDALKKQHVQKRALREMQEKRRQEREEMENTNKIVLDALQKKQEMEQTKMEAERREEIYREEIKRLKEEIAKKPKCVIQ